MNYCRSIALLAYLVMFAATGVHAQDICDEEMDTSDNLHSSQWRAQVQPLIDAGKFREGHAVIVEKYRSRIDSFSGLGMAEVGIVDDAIDRYLDVVGNSMFRQRGPADWTVNPTFTTDDVVIRLGDIRGSPNRASDDVVLSCPQIRLAGTAERAIAYFAVAMSSIADPPVEPVAFIAETEYRDFENWLDNGLEMWPWELWINGRNLPDTGAPTSQTIFLRPSGLIGLQFDGTDDSVATYGMALELFGKVKYASQSDRKKWKGISLMASVTNDRGVGYGFLTRFNRYVLGLAYHDSDDAVLLYFNLDLQKFVLGENSQAEQADDFLKCLAFKLGKTDSCEEDN